MAGLFSGHRARSGRLVSDTPSKSLEKKSYNPEKLRELNSRRPISYTKLVYCRRSVWRGLRPKQRGNKRKQSKPLAEPRRRALEGQKQHSNNESYLLIRVINKL
jgi:hypothetical protein